MAILSAAKVAAISAVVFALIVASAAKLVLSAPMAWSSVAAWLRPLYLYVVVNAIIISIAASSRFQYSSNDHHDHHRDHHDHRGDNWNTVDEKLSPAASAVPEEDVLGDRHRPVAAVVDPEVIIKTVEPDDDHHQADDDHDRDDDIDDDDDDDDESVMTETPKRTTESLEEKILTLSPEKPLVSPRLNIGHRKPDKPTPDQGVLRELTVTKPKQHDSLENTWKAITEGRSTPLSRQMRKCDTWENHGRQITPFDFDDGLDPTSVKKSETFRDRTNQQQPAVPTALVLRKDPSLSQDELNRRVEAFIKKFNDEMRLQRQESLNRYLEMINRGTH